MENSLSIYLKSIKIPEKSSHKGQNGRLLLVGGSHLFHAASLWSLTTASRIVDLVHYASIEENNKIVQNRKEEFRNGIIIPRSEIESYIDEDDCILIGPGMVREDQKSIRQLADKKQKYISKIKNLKEVNQIQDEGVLTYYLTKYLLEKYPHKKWVIDAGSLQMMELSWIPKNAILTPHRKEFEMLKFKVQSEKLKVFLKTKKLDEQLKLFAKEYNCIILLKGEVDYIASPTQFEKIEGGNAGMTKGGTGDVLAGLVAALYCKNDAFSSAVVASYINKKAGDDLFKTHGYWFNASDLSNQIPKTMKEVFERTSPK
ncbi:NAD(P)H-hydrate dehydratase [Candidatus Gottesmanbacteria bacterium]|nr:NAD(P)H-hydrate dehydratase [Candidatus Gottesmanbacteria bacterium]